MGRVLMIIAVLIDLMASAQASPVQEYGQFWFSTTNGSLMNHYLTIFKDLREVACTVIFSWAPSYHNCTESESWLFAVNETSVEMVTKDPNTTDYSMEHGTKWQGDGLNAILGGKLSNTEFKEKIAKYIKLSNGATTPRPLDGDNSFTDPTNSATTLPPLDGDNSLIVKIVVPVVVVLLLVISFYALHKHSPAFRRRINLLLPCLGNRPGNVNAVAGNGSSATGNGSSATGNGSSATGNGSSATGNGSHVVVNVGNGTVNYINSAGNDINPNLIPRNGYCAVPQSEEEPQSFQEEPILLSSSS